MKLLVKVAKPAKIIISIVKLHFHPEGGKFYLRG
jgi:hypothetical protein